MKGFQAHVSNIQGLAMSPAGVLLANGMNVNELRVMSTMLRKEEWMDLDTTLVNVARKLLNGIADLRTAGLVYNLGSLGVLTSEWESLSSMTDANVDMSGEARDTEDSVDFTLQGVPIPIIHKGFRLNIRRLEASRRMGSNLDTTNVAEATRKVILKQEDMLFNGLSIKNDGYSIYGYTTFPHRLMTNIGTAWDASSGQDPVADVSHMISVLMSKSFYGPFGLYVPVNYWQPLMEDYDTYKEGTWYSRIMDFEQISFIKPTSALSSNEVVLVQLTRDVVDLAVGQDITVVPWNEMGGMVSHFKVMAAMAPRLKYTQDESGNSVSGILHAFEASTSTTTT